MRATDFIRANADKDGRVSLEIAIEGAYMARDDAITSLRNQTAANMVPAILQAYYQEDNTQFRSFLSDIMNSDRKNISEVISDIAVGYADELIKRLKQEE